MKHFCSFSEAIREGAKLRPQATMRLFEEVLGGSIGSCAIGAGYEAITGEISLTATNEIYDYVGGAFPYVEGDEWLKCPIDNCDEPPLEGLSEVILHLNDDHRWAREAIADWLESEEEKLGFITISEEAERSSPSPAPEYVMAQ